MKFIKEYYFERFGLGYFFEGVYLGMLGAAIATLFYWAVGLIGPCGG